MLALTASSSDLSYQEKLASAQFYMGHTLPKSAGLRITVESDNSLLLGLPDEAF